MSEDIIFLLLLFQVASERIIYRSIGLQIYFTLNMLTEKRERPIFCIGIKICTLGFISLLPHQETQ